jgi:hypothetical protein
MCVIAYGNYSVVRLLGVRWQGHAVSYGVLSLRVWRVAFYFVLEKIIRVAIVWYVYDKGGTTGGCIIDVYTYITQFQIGKVGLYILPQNPYNINRREEG